MLPRLCDFFVTIEFGFCLWRRILKVGVKLGQDAAQKRFYAYFSGEKPKYPQSLPRLKQQIGSFGDDHCAEQIVSTVGDTQTARCTALPCEHSSNCKRSFVSEPPVRTGRVISNRREHIPD